MHGHRLTWGDIGVCRLTVAIGGLSALLAGACGPKSPADSPAATGFDGLWCQFVGGRRQSSLVLDLEGDGSVSRMRQAAPNQSPDEANRVIRQLTIAKGKAPPLGRYEGKLGQRRVRLDINYVNATKPEFREYQGLAQATRPGSTSFEPPRPVSCVAFRRRR